MVEDKARAFGSGVLYVNAAVPALGFYRATGWHSHVWDPSELVGIAASCEQMRKFL